MKRDNNLDFLRIIMAVMVIVIHVSSVYFYVNDNMVKATGDFTVANFYDSFVRVAVPIFVMMSGGFILSDKRNSEYRYFYEKTWKKIVIPSLMWTAFYIFFQYILLFYDLSGKIGKIDYIIPIKNTLLGSPFYHLWYLYMSFGLYLVTPILIKIKNEIGEKKFMKMAFIMLIFAIPTAKYSDLFWTVKFMVYIPYYILGHSLKKFYREKYSFTLFFAGWAISSFLIFEITEIIVKKNLYQRTLYFYDNLSPLVIIAALSLYLMFLNIKKEIKIDFSSFAEKTFNIYLIHAAILEVVIRVPKITYTLSKSGSSIYVIPLLSILVLFLSYIVASLLKKRW